MRTDAALKISGLCLGLCFYSQIHAQTIVQDSFTGVSATQTWTVTGTAGYPCMTAGNGSGSVPACSGISDPVGSGALRLTGAGGDLHGAIISTTPFSLSQGLQVTFTTYTYGGNSYPSTNGKTPGADGIGFYLIDAAYTPAIGAYGGSLGYSCSNTNSPFNGMVGGYMGLGIDEYGNFLNVGDNTASGYPNASNTGFLNTQNPGEIGIRGSGSIAYSYLNSIYPAYFPSSQNGTSQGNTAIKNACKNGKLYTAASGGGNNAVSPTVTVQDYAYVTGVTLPTTQPIANEATGVRTSATPITYKVLITPGTTPLLSVWYAYNSTGGSSATYTPVITNLNISNASNAAFATLPANLYFGFGASTGGGTNIHEITCFIAAPANSAIGAPVAPLSVSAGGLVFTVSSNQNPLPAAGHVTAYATVTTATAGSPLGTATGNALWDAGDSTHMSPSNRTSNLMSTGVNAGGSTPAGSGSIVAFNALDTAAFNLTTSQVTASTFSGCLGTTVSQAITIITGYTIDPNYTSSVAGCSYLSGRVAGWELGSFDVNNTVQYLGPPGNGNLLTQPGYVTWAKSQNGRLPLLLFSDNDGFLYAIDASSDSTSGYMQWGWMPRPFVQYLYNYAGGSIFYTQGYFDGGFQTADAVDGSGNWATYVVGTAQAGAYHYSLKLANVSSTGAAAKPTSQAWGISVTGGTSPQEQAPIIATINGAQYAIFIVNTTSGSTTTSTLYEINVATGAGSTVTGPLSFVVSSSMNYVTNTGILWLGDNNGGVWSLSLTGSASTDASGAYKVVSSLTPSTTPNAINYVGYTEVAGQPYLWAATQYQVSVYALANGIGQYQWATRGGSSPVGTSAKSVTVNALQSTGQVSALPTAVNGVLFVPVYVPSSGASCGALGNGYYDVFNLTTGTTPNGTVSFNGTLVTNGVIALGQGSPYAPSTSAGQKGTSTTFYPGSGTSQSTAPGSGTVTSSVSNKPISWRVH
ncbi:MAG: hypothetical protein JOY60_09045 [Burkholderiaceae bacterium]|nr:hypothetical protein [Burkholderiaceae bacterium]